MIAAQTANSITITLPIGDEPLKNRHCGCGCEEFRAVMGTPIKWRAICDQWDDDEHERHCGRLINERTGLRCGDWTTDGELWDDTSPSSVPLAVCIGCGRLVRLV